MVHGKVCIILPVYNVQGFLERSISSILAQSYRSFDVYLVDDGSSDGSGELCDEIADKYENIFCFHKSNGGAGDARNFGIDNIGKDEYEYVSFVDPDDLLEQKYLEELVAKINGADLAICGYKTVTYDCNNKIIGEKAFIDAHQGYYSDYAEELSILHRNSFLFAPWNKLYRVSIIKEHNLRFGTTKQYEDTTFVYRYLGYCSSISVTTDCLYLYSKFIKGRKTAVSSFGNEYCEGAFMAFEEGQKVVSHMLDLRMDGNAVKLFQERLDNHLHTSILGEMIVNLSFSHLSWKQRRDYLNSLITRFHCYFTSFDEKKESGISKMACRFANRGRINCVVMMSYLYKIRHCC